MRSFQHNIDGMIIILVDGKRYQDTLENFKQDYSSSYGLPLGYVGRVFIEEQDHYLIKESALEGWRPDNNEVLESVWEEGTSIFKAFSSITEQQGLRVQAANEAQIKENLLREQLREERSSRPNPLAKYHNIVRMLQEAGLLDKLLKSTNFSSLAKLGLNTTLLYDDEHIKESLYLVVQGIQPPLTKEDTELFDLLLGKAEFDFTLSSIFKEKDGDTTDA